MLHPIYHDPSIHWLPSLLQMSKISFLVLIIVAQPIRKENSWWKSHWGKVPSTMLLPSLLMFFYPTKLLVEKLCPTNFSWHWGFNMAPSATIRSRVGSPSLCWFTQREIVFKFNSSARTAQTLWGFELLPPIAFLIFLFFLVLGSLALFLLLHLQCSNTLRKFENPNWIYYCSNWLNFSYLLMSETNYSLLPTKNIKSITTTTFT